MHSHLNTYDLRLGGQIGVVARLTNAAEGTVNPTALKDVVNKAIMDVVEPNGAEKEVPMYDDGLHFDSFANDGIYGGFIAATQTGIYRTSAWFEGTAPNGVNLIRSTQHLIPIVEERVSFTGKASAVKKDDQHLNVQLFVDHQDSNTYRAYTELWGTDSNGKEIPVCWLAGMVVIEEVANSPAVILELDINWIKRAGAVAPFTLKNLLLQDSSVYVPIDQMIQIPLEVTGNILPHVTGPMSIEITKEMKQGVFPKELLRNASAAAPTLLAVHGYCSDVNPWQKYMEDFTSTSFFLERLASLTNEKFAQLALKHSETLGMTRWSGVGHSQGGNVLVHIFNYYFSGMDQAANGRIIQSLGTPFQGNTGAGSAANLIKLFGFGCGENFDLTTDGANLWLPGITTDTRKQVYSYTTTYVQGKFFGDHCNLAVNLLLKWPNDGVTELALAPLKGGNSLGNKDAWCHTVSMNYPAQYYDHDRNKEMNRLAAR